MKTEYRHGPKIKSFRMQRGWTQEHLAEVSGVSCRTVQRLERDVTQGLEALMAVASALETSVDELQTAYWVAERKPLRSLRIERPEDFVEAIERASHSFSYQKLALLTNEDSSRVDELLSAIFADLWAMSPDEPELLSSWINWVCEPLAELRSMGLIFFSIQECRDIFLKGSEVGQHIPLEDWTRCDFILVRQNSCFHLGGRGSKQAVHEFNPRCAPAVEAVHRMYREKLEVGIFASAVHGVNAAGGEDKLNWCDVCFPAEQDGTRIGYKYIERVTGLSKYEIDQRLVGSDRPIIESPS